MSEKNSFILYQEYEEHFNLLTDEEKGELVTALFFYNRTGEEPALSGMVKMAFSFIKCQMERDAEKYKKTVEKRAAAGKQGGRPKKEDEKANGFSEKQTKAKKAKGFSEKQKKLNVDVDDTVDVDVDEDVDEDVDDTYTPQTPQKKQKPVKVPFAEFVAMTNGEYASLVGKFGESDTKRLIEILDNYKGSTGKTYKSDYRAILSWVTDKLKKEREQHPAAFGDALAHDELEQLARKKMLGG